ncbi:MAG: glycosyl hydrolase family 18 protein [Gemmatimonadaceae bacterium]
MSRAFRGLLAVALVSACAGHALPPSEALWYSRNNDESIASFEANASHISIISPQVFGFDTLGNISGSVDPRVIAAARANRVKLVPLVMNPGFSQPLIHRILSVPSVRANAIRSLAALCRVNHLDGIQFDIENVHVSDKDAFTSFVRESVDSLHRAGCTASAAVVPRLDEDPGVTPYQKWIFDNWRAAYDYKALADTLDFISFMTYAQHTGGSTPGPVAGFPWMEASLRHVLSSGVPPSKISLGIPAYSDYWLSAYDSAAGSRMRGNDIAYPALMDIMSRAGASPQWDDVQKSPYAMWEDHGVFEHAWLEDARAFKAKLQLVRTYRLRGYSVWLLGLEDPATWSIVGPVSR